MEEGINYNVNFKPSWTSVEYAGLYCLGGSVGLKINLGKKPKLIHRYFMRILLGWVWIDAIKKQ